ncbi:MAG: RagB/SusD family nutrient uptake outer membrane protein [Leadbetterella sp.]
MLNISCTDEYLNPSTASEQQVVNDVNGLITLCNGLQFRFSVGRASPAYTVPTSSGLTTKELTVLNAGNTDEENLRIGGLGVQSINGVITNLWNQNNIVKANADIILENVSKVNDANTKGSIIAYASIFKAMALGNLAMFFEQAPISVGENAIFSKREDILKAAINTLESAATSYSGSSTNFNNRIAAGIDIPNTIQALIARYAIMLGDSDKALAAANKVDLTKRSIFNFDDISRNALFENTFSNRNVTEPVGQGFALPSELAVDPKDKRITFFFQTTVPGNNLARASFFTANTTAVPIYRPGEIMLIKAEAFARKSSLADAVAEIDKVLTKKTDAVGIGADLSAYSGEKTQSAILNEIFKQRSIECYLMGMKLEDSRRFNRPPGERNRTFYPYPQSERDNNRNTPVDPTS